MKLTRGQTSLLHRLAITPGGLHYGDFRQETRKALMRRGYIQPLDARYQYYGISAAGRAYYDSLDDPQPRR